MTLIEFNEAAKAIVDKSALGPCTITCSAEIAVRANGDLEYQYKVTAHPSSGMITSWQEPNAYLCNSPRLALERFKIAIKGRFDPPSEPEAITEIEELAEDFPTVDQLADLWAHCLSMSAEQLVLKQLHREFTESDGKRTLYMYFAGGPTDIYLFSIAPEFEPMLFSSERPFEECCKIVGFNTDMPFALIESEPSDQQVHALWDHCLDLTPDQLEACKVIKDYSAIVGSRLLEMYSAGDDPIRLFSISLDLEGLSYSSPLGFADVCKAVGLEMENEVGNG